MPKRIDLTGQLFDHWTVIEPAPSIRSGKKKRTFWWCRGACGLIKQIRTDELRFDIPLCDCFRPIFRRTVVINTFTTHGKKRTAEYRIFHHMLDRCNNPSTQMYPVYGGKGIKVLWESFEEFYRDMGDRPGPGYTIDRKDSNGPYCKDNCRWATQKTQQNNRGNNHRITYQGKTQTIAQWSEETSFKPATIWQRLQRWSVERTLTEPLHPGRWTR